MARLCPLFSGSSGNSYYIGSRSAGLLLDAGRSARQLDNMLRVCGIDPLAVQGILLTHEHTDHVNGVRVFAKKYHLPIIASQGTLQALEGALADAETHVAETGMQLADMTVTPFHTSHDCAESLGFRIKTEDDRCFTLSTDLGCLSEEVMENLLGADFAVIESNHDVEMLRNGGYPYHLKRRILSDRGHLSNAACAAFLPKRARSGTKRILLAHLSRENNTRAIALETALASLVEAGYVPNVDFLLDAARPENTDGKTMIF